MRRLSPIPYAITCGLLASIGVVAVLIGGRAVLAQDEPTLRTDEEIAQMQRDLRDACEDRRKAAQDAGDEEERQYWLVQVAIQRAAISARELRRRTAPVTPPGPGDAPADPADPPKPGASLSADAPPGSIGHPVYSDGVILFMARIRAGDRLIVQSWHEDERRIITGWLTDADERRMVGYAGGDIPEVPAAMEISTASIGNLPPGRHQVQLWVVPGANSSARNDVLNPARIDITIRGDQ